MMAAERARLTHSAPRSRQGGRCPRGNLRRQALGRDAGQLWLATSLGPAELELTAAPVPLITDSMPLEGMLKEGVAVLGRAGHPQRLAGAQRTRRDGGMHERHSQAPQVNL